MTVDFSPTAQPAYLVTLTDAIAAFRDKTSPRPSGDTVVSALLQAEKAARHRRLTYPFSALVGDWQLCFATGTCKARQRGGILLGQGWYVPSVAKAQISFASSQTVEPDLDRTADCGYGKIGNQACLGPLLIAFTGPCKYLGKKNLLAFDFTQMQIQLFGRTLYEGAVRGGKAQADNFHTQSISSLPFFAFFLVTEDLIAARGRGGGLALWVRDSAHSSFSTSVSWLK
jgi:hypothetical protein